MLKKISLISFMLLATSAHAADIDGAFGIRFNEKMEKANKSLDNYEVKPKTKFELFQEYYVALTPKSKKVYSITASGDVQTTCREDMNLVKTALEDKYTDFDKINVFTQKNANNPYSSVTFKKDKTNIILSCDEKKNTIAITYINFDTEKEAEDEKVEIMDKNIKDKQKTLNVDGL